MYAWILMSGGIETPNWEQYLPCVITQIQFLGHPIAEEHLRVWAARLGIPVYSHTVQVPDIVIAFWNGTPDFVDDTVAKTAAQTFLYLPNERGGGYALL